MKYIVWILILVLALWVLYAGFSNPMNTTPPDGTATSTATVKITPVSHASLALEYEGKTLYADPVGDAVLYASLAKPDVIVITHDHQDHFSTSTLGALVASSTNIYVPQAVMDKLPANLKTQASVVKNGQTVTASGFSVEAVPAYNLREADKARHAKGAGNGYVITAGDERIYIAGDTEDIPEMRALQNIDVAFIPMNLPFTMSVEKAAEAVLAFKPARVYPYHYRTPEGLSDVSKFKQLVEAGSGEIEVIEVDWYKK